MELFQKKNPGAVKVTVGHAEVSTEKPSGLAVTIICSAASGSSASLTYHERSTVFDGAIPASTVKFCATGLLFTAGASATSTFCVVVVTLP